MSNASSQTITDQTEIERIMKEIEDLERKLSPESTPAPSTTTTPEPAALSPEPTPPPPPPATEPTAPTLTAVAPPPPPTASPQDVSESLAEAIAVTPITPTFNTQENTMSPNTPNLSDETESLLTSTSFESPLAGDGSLGLKVSGCTEIQLEFARAGVSVSLFCTDTGLVIRTDQGAEFKVPFATPLAAPRAA